MDDDAKTMVVGTLLIGGATDSAEKNIFLNSVCRFTLGEGKDYDGGCQRCASPVSEVVYSD